MADNHSCPTCGMWTQAGKDAFAKRAKENPIYKTDFSVPLSETIDKLRSEICSIRGQLGDIRSAYPGWGERTSDVEGLLTCGLIALYDIAKEMRKFEERKEQP
jgi:hypothetical protein